MSNDKDLREKFWKHLKSDRTVFLGVTGGEHGHAQPMTAIVQDEDCSNGVVWFFTSVDVDLAGKTGAGREATMHFASKGHDVWACVHGTLSIDNNRAVIERLWSPFIAAWYKGGKDDPKLRLLRFDAAHAQVWLNENSLFAGIKLMLGADPKTEYKDKVAEVSL
jgi:general stress protein 26